MFPQIVEVDPNELVLDERNPRKHEGEEFARLKLSITELGVIQMPTVRVLPGNRYQVIDGEGRVLVMRELGSRSMFVVSYGRVDDLTALEMLEASNTVRSFSFIAECRGLARIYREGKTGKEIAKSMGATAARPIQDQIAIGHFPETLLKTIERDIQEGQKKHDIRWGMHTLCDLLPLRQVQAGHGKAGTFQRGEKQLEWFSIDDHYSYEEVERAVERIREGDIRTNGDLSAYVEKRRRELFEERFDKELQASLRQKIEETDAALRSSYEEKVLLEKQTFEKQMTAFQEQIAKRVEGQISALQQQYTDLNEQYKKVLSDSARRPELIEKREKELTEKLQEAERKLLEVDRIKQEEQARWQKMQEEEREKALFKQKEEEQRLKRHLQEALSSQSAEMEKQLQKTRADLESFYAKRDKERQLKAQNSVLQSIQHGNELLAQTIQWIELMTSPDMIKGLGWVERQNIDALLLLLRSARERIEIAEFKIERGAIVDAKESQA